MEPSPSESHKRPCPSIACGRGRAGFTSIELLVLIVTIAMLATVLVPALSKTKQNSKALQCINNYRQIMVAWKLYASDNLQVLVAANHQTGTDPSGHPTYNGRPIWMTGNLDFSGGNPSDWDTNQDITKSPLWNYSGKTAGIFKCPSDPSTVTVAGKIMPRIRSVSMNMAFSDGEWFIRTYNPSQTAWRTYSKDTDIPDPARTWVTIDEHPDSINDGALALACTGNQPTDPPSQSVIIDYPSNLHNRGCGISFADGHAEIHKWLGIKLGNEPFINNSTGPANYPADAYSLDSWVDMHWLAARTSVHR